MNCIGLFVRLQVGLLVRLHVLHRIVGEITSTCCVGLLGIVRLQVLCRIVGEITSTL